MPSQHLNLLDAVLQTRAAPRYSARQVVLAALAVFALTGTAALLVQTMAAREATALAQLPPLPRAGVAGTPVAPASPSASAPRAAEMARLRALDAAQRRVAAALRVEQGGAPGAAEGEGYAGYFLALARQARADLWITGFAAHAGGLELSGRMLDAAVLPAYLRTLNAEPRFRGRPFAQLQIRAVEGDATYTEFVLRSQPSAAGAGP